MSTTPKDLFRAVRDENGWSQQQLAERLQISRNYVNLIEGGKKKPSEKLLNQLAELTSQLGVKRPQIDAEGRRSLARGPAPARPGAMLLNEKFQTAANEPTPEQILRYVENYLTVAQRAPGGLGYAWGKIRESLDPETLRRMEDIPREH